MPPGTSLATIGAPIARGERIYGQEPAAKTWRHWYASIADLMIVQPGITYKDIAERLGKHPNTVGMIVQTDAFRTYFAARRNAFETDIDSTIKNKLSRVAEKALDGILDHMDRKRDSVPIGQLTGLATSALDRLGYGPKPSAAVQINNNVSATNTSVAVPASTLLEARERLRQNEQGFAEPPRAAASIGQSVLEPPKVAAPTGQSALPNILEGEIVSSTSDGE